MTHDWSKLDYAAHTSKDDITQLSHQNDWGYRWSGHLYLRVKQEIALSWCHGSAAQPLLLSHCNVIRG